MAEGIPYGGASAREVETIKRQEDNQRETDECYANGAVHNSLLYLICPNAKVSGNWGLERQRKPPLPLDCRVIFL